MYKSQIKWRIFGFIWSRDINKRISSSYRLLLLPPFSRVLSRSKTGSKSTNATWRWRLVCSLLFSYCLSKRGVIGIATQTATNRIVFPFWLAISMLTSTRRFPENFLQIHRILESVQPKDRGPPGRRFGIFPSVIPECARRSQLNIAFPCYSGSCVFFRDVT